MIARFGGRPAIQVARTHRPVGPMLSHVVAVSKVIAPDACGCPSNDGARVNPARSASSREIPGRRCASRTPRRDPAGCANPWRLAVTSRRGQDLHLKPQSARCVFRAQHVRGGFVAIFSTRSPCASTPNERGRGIGLCADGSIPVGRQVVETTDEQRFEREQRIAVAGPQPLPGTVQCADEIPTIDHRIDRHCATFVVVLARLQSIEQRVGCDEQCDQRIRGTTRRQGWRDRDARRCHRVDSRKRGRLDRIAGTTRCRRPITRGQPETHCEPAGPHQREPSTAMRDHHGLSGS